MYDDILLPTESNPGSRQAVELAIDLADRYGAALHVLYVVEDPDDALARLPADERRTELSAEGKAAIDEVETAAEAADVPVHTRVGTGEPEFSITQHVDRVPADFVVMGTHGRSGVERLLVGSVAEEVVRNAGVPVLVVPLSDDA